MIYKWSNIGSYHQLKKGENEDYICSKECEEKTVITLADGVSSCAESKHGAMIAGDAITYLLSKKGVMLMEFDQKQIAKITTKHILYELEQNAIDNNHEITDYSSTVASVMFDKNSRRLLCYNLGDEIIIGVSKGKCRILAMPYDSTDGCCVTTTKNSEAEAIVKIINADSIDSVIICSDGAWREMFKSNRIRKDIVDMLTSRDYDALTEYLKSKNSTDDCSYIAMDINDRRLS